MEQLFKLLEAINIGQLLAIGCMMWFFYNRMDQKVEKVKTELKQDMNKLAEKVEDIDRRLCRIEGSLATKGHCLIEQSSIHKKAE